MFGQCVDIKFSHPPNKGSVIIACVAADQTPFLRTASVITPAVRVSDHSTSVRFGSYGLEPNRTILKCISLFMTITGKFEGSITISVYSGDREVSVHVYDVLELMSTCEQHEYCNWSEIWQLVEA